MQPTASKAVWWIKSPTKGSWGNSKRKQSVGASFAADLADLFRNISMHGYSKLVAPELSLSEKLIWLAVHTTTMCTLLVVLSLIWEQFVAQYIVINLHNPLYPVELIAFPAVSICSNNRISRQAVMQHAEELSLRDPLNNSAEYFMEQMQLFSTYFEKKENRGFSNDEGSKFQAFLDIYDTWDNETFYNTRRILRLLTPSCESFVRRCLLAGVEIDCFSNTAFQTSLTSYGFCCTFNKENSYQVRGFRDKFVNPELGLTVVLNASNADNFAPVLNVDGYIVMVHNPNEFPDVASGETQEVVLTHGEESFIEINVRKIDTDSTLRSFGSRMRKCYFDDDLVGTELMTRANYSFSDCLTRCRMRSVLALCRCLPFYMPLKLLQQEEGVVYCTLQHVPCLLSYHSMEDALYCPQCMAACDDLQYKLSLMSLPIDRYRESLTKEQWESIGLAPDEITVMRVHFEQPFAKYYRRMVGNTWFEALCTVGNVTSIFLGFSIVAVFELAFFIIRYLVIGIKASVKQNRKEHGKARKGSDKLYICP